MDYAHAYEGHFVEQDYLPCDRVYYEPTEEGHEKETKKRLDERRRASKRRSSPGSG